jgi:hypothetical protein
MLQIDETICFANVLAMLTVLPSCCKAIPIIPGVPNCDTKLLIQTAAPMPSGSYLH